MKSSNGDRASMIIHQNIAFQHAACRFINFGLESTHAMYSHDNFPELNR